uniref:Uncharacterized protein n=1 Tax=Utricularia reniformis TaxID=192314 RepID=A0A1Y0B2W2_9LAMI|nr:hypothetical protein AEK19_MT1541 [Utricularia reniformis]ART31728.1 hypothetical protein AEK19_MT1541 [Utricularia reniformis]
MEFNIRLTNLIQDTVIRHSPLAIKIELNLEVLIAPIPVDSLLSSPFSLSGITSILSCNFLAYIPFSPSGS